MSSGTGREHREPWFRLREISRVDPLVLKIQVSLMSMWRGRLSQPSVESPAAKRAASPDREGHRAKDLVDTQKKDETLGPTGPGMPISYAPKYTDDNGDLRDTAANPESFNPGVSRGNAQLCEHTLPGAPGGGARAEASGG